MLHALLFGGLALLSSQIPAPWLRVRSGRPIIVEMTVSTVVANASPQEPEPEPMPMEMASVVERPVAVVEEPAMTVPEPVIDAAPLEIAAVAIPSTVLMPRERQEPEPRREPPADDVEVRPPVTAPARAVGMSPVLADREHQSQDRDVRPPVQVERRPVPVPTPASLAFEPEELGLDVDELPRPLPANLPPAYPREALASRIEGRVLVRIWIQSDGSVERVAVHESSGFQSLDESALTAVRQWQFAPARRAGYAVAHDVLLPIKFTLRR